MSFVVGSVSYHHHLHHHFTDVLLHLCHPVWTARSSCGCRRKRHCTGNSVEYPYHIISPYHWVIPKVKPFAGCHDSRLPGVFSLASWRFEIGMAAWHKPTVKFGALSWPQSVWTPLGGGWISEFVWLIFWWYFWIVYKVLSCITCNSWGFFWCVSTYLLRFWAPWLLRVPKNDWSQVVGAQRWDCLWDPFVSVSWPRFTPLKTQQFAPEEWWLEGWLFLSRWFLLGGHVIFWEGTY